MGCPFENIFDSVGSTEPISLTTKNTVDLPLQKWGRRQLTVDYYVRKAWKDIHATVLYLFPYLISVSPHPTPQNNRRTNNTK